MEKKLYKYLCYATAWLEEYEKENPERTKNSICLNEVIESYTSQSREIESISDEEKRRNAKTILNLVKIAERYEEKHQGGLFEWEFHDMAEGKRIANRMRDTLSAKGKKEEECSECNCIGHNSENIKYHYSGCSQASLKQWRCPTYRQ